MGFRTFHQSIVDFIRITITTAVTNTHKLQNNQNNNKNNAKQQKQQYN